MQLDGRGDIGRRYRGHGWVIVRRSRNIGAGSLDVERSPRAETTNNADSLRRFLVEDVQGRIAIDDSCPLSVGRKPKVRPCTRPQAYARPDLSFVTGLC